MGTAVIQAVSCLETAVGVALGKRTWKPSDNLRNCVQCQLSQFTRCLRRDNSEDRDCVKVVTEDVDAVSNDDVTGSLKEKY